MPPDLISAIQPNIAALPESGIVEIVNYARERKGLIPLWIGEGDLPTPAFISDAAMAALRDGQTFYTYQRGIPPLRQAIGAYLGRTYGVTVDPERVFVTVGGMQAIKQTIQMLIGPGDELVIPSPVWPNIFNAAQIMGGVVKPITLTFGNDGWTLDVEKLFAACTDRTKAIFINTPGNPTGWMMPREDMIALRDFARERGIWLIVDEVYGRLTYDIDHAPSFLEIIEPDDRVVVVNTFSKNWAMTGWRIGWVVAPKELGQVYENLIQYNTSGVPTFLQFGAVAAMNEGESFVGEMRERCRIGREIVSDAFDRLPRVRFVRPPGTFYMFFMVDGEPDSRALAFKLADQANVGLAPGSAFGEGGEPFLRLCFCLSADKLSEAMDRLSGVLR